MGAAVPERERLGPAVRVLRILKRRRASRVLLGSLIKRPHGRGAGGVLEWTSTNESLRLCGEAVVRQDRGDRPQLRAGHQVFGAQRIAKRVRGRARERGAGAFITKSDQQVHGDEFRAEPAAGDRHPLQRNRRREHRVNGLPADHPGHQLSFEFSRAVGEHCRGIRPRKSVIRQHRPERLRGAGAVLHAGEHHVPRLPALHVLAGDSLKGADQRHRHAREHAHGR